eukprot:UN10501
MLNASFVPSILMPPIHMGELLYDDRHL